MVFHGLGSGQSPRVAAVLGGRQNGAPPALAQLAGGVADARARKVQVVEITAGLSREPFHLYVDLARKDGLPRFSAVVGALDLSPRGKAGLRRDEVQLPRVLREPSDLLPRGAAIA